MRKEFDRSTRTTYKKGFSNMTPILRLALGVLCGLLLGGTALAQKTIILIDGDAGRTISTVHEFSFDKPTYTFTLKNRTTHGLAMKVELLRSDKFNEGPYSLKESLPLTIPATGTGTLTFNVDYGRSIRDKSSVTLLIYPEGDTDKRKRGITLDISMSAQGKVMFWDDRTNRYLSTLPVNHPFIQLAWNGTGTGSARFFSANDARGAFFLTLNKTGAAPIPANTVIPLRNKASKVYTVSYSPPYGRWNAGDYAQLIFQDAADANSAIAITVNSKGRSASTTFADLNAGNVSAGLAGNPGGVVNPGGFNDPGGNGAYGNPGGTGNPGAGVGNPGGTGVPGGSGDPGGGTTYANGNPYNGGTAGGPNPGSGVGNPGSNGTAPGVGFDPGVDGGVSGGGERPIYDAETAAAILNAIFENRKTENHVRVNKTDFVKDENSTYPDKFVTKLPLQLDTLGNDPNFGIKPRHAAVVTDEDSIELQILAFNPDSSRMVLGVHPEDEDRILDMDSFRLSIGLTPYYLAGDAEVYLEDQSQVLTAETIAEVKRESRLWLWILILVLLFLALFFLIGRLWIRRPIYSFRYLREARYQRERFKKQQEEDYTIPTETIYVDLNRHEEDLIQLNFLTRAGEESDDAVIKAKELSATVPSPHRKGLRQFFIWFYGLFGVDKEPRFNAVYYSFRIEPQKGGIPQHLRLKDSEGLLLLGTSLTNNVLATDHQDFRFRKRPFSYSIFLDPTEILDYSGSMRTVSLLFRIIEEPFEGYISTRDFKVDLEINRRL